MACSRRDARWGDAILLTLALWLFVLLIFLPVIIERHSGAGWLSIALDSWTVLVSTLLAMPLFALFRLSIGWKPGTRVAILVAGVIGAAVANRTFDIVWTGWVTENLEASWSNFPATIERNYGAILNYTLVFSVNMALFQLSFARRRELRRERQLAEAQGAAQHAQLTALRYQLNPHFLFNTLNSISALIVTRRNEDAERMTDKLSSFLRASLACDPARLVPLDDELAMLEEYLEIEAVRFGDRLRMEVECDPEARDALVPGFLVQLVENAIKHGVAPSREPVNIALRATMEGKQLRIIVSNDHAGSGARREREGRAGVGLENVRRRLEAVYGSAATLETEQSDCCFTATISIPEIQRAH